MALKILFFILLFNLKPCLCGNMYTIMNNSFETIKEDFKSCITSLLGSFFRFPYFSKEVIVTNFNVKHKQIAKIIITNESKELSFEHIHLRLFLFDLRNSEPYLLQFFKSNNFINRRGTFIFLQEKLNSSFFQSLQNFFLKPVYIVEETLQMYKFDPFENGNASQSSFSPSLLGSCNNVTVDFKHFKCK